MAEHVKTYVFERLTARRAGIVVERAFGCMQELKRSFTLRASGPLVVGSSLVKPGGSQVESSAPELPASETRKASKRSVSKVGSPPSEPVFFATTRGTVIHVRAPGPAWARLCGLRTSRASRPALSGAQVIEFGGIGRARTQGRRFCEECLARAGCQDDESARAHPS